MKNTQRQIHTIDATNRPLGRLASEAALVLRGKDKADFLRNVDAGSFVQVVNFKAVKITGNKMEQKEYYKHSGYPGGLRTTKLKNLWEKNPAEALRLAVYGMLPKNKLRPKMIKRLSVKM